jgi:heat-inducible transcriptional repressor
MGRPGLVASEAEGVRCFYAEAEHELSDILRETSALLSQLTSYVAVVAAPTLRRARIRRVTVVPLGIRRAMAVVVTDSGQVANQTIEFGHDVSAAVLTSVEAYLSRTLDGAVGDDAETVRRTIEGVPGHEAGVALKTLDVVLACLAEADQDRVLTGGVSALLGHPEFSDPAAVRPLVGLLEDSLSMLKVLSDVMRTPDVDVRIGHENPATALEHASFIATRYGEGDAGGIIGVIGPTRMDYRRTMAAVRTVSDALTDVLES